MKRIIPGLWLLAIVACITVPLWEWYSFKVMSPAQHLRRAQSESKDHLAAVDRALEHLAAIPANSQESAKAKELEKELRTQQRVLLEAEITKAAAMRQAEASIAQARAARFSAVSELRSTLKNLGYDVNVEASSDPDEVSITSPEFADTDHRVPFLAFIRGEKAPILCSVGINKLRLRSSQFPLVGLNESYSLDCFKYGH